MNTSTIFETLFKRDITDEGNDAFLQQQTQDHPYFSAAHYFLLNQTHEFPLTTIFYQLNL